MSTAAAILGSAAIGAGASLFGASKTEKAQKQALAQQKQIYEQNVARAQPYLDAGDAGLQKYRDATGLNGPEAQQAYYASFQNEPGWEAAQAAGVKAIERGSSRSGLFGSGNTLAGLYDYGLKNQWAAYNDRLGQYGNTINWGQGALGSITGSGNAFANQTGNAFANIGNAQAGGATGVAQAANDGMQNWLNYTRYGQGRAAGGAAPAGGWDTFTVGGV